MQHITVFQPALDYTASTVFCGGVGAKFVAGETVKCTAKVFNSDGDPEGTAALTNAFSGQVSQQVEGPIQVEYGQETGTYTFSFKPTIAGDNTLTVLYVSGEGAEVVGSASRTLLIMIWRYGRHRRSVARSGLASMANTAGQWHALVSMLWLTPQASGTL